MVAKYKKVIIGSRDDAVRAWNIIKQIHEDESDPYEVVFKKHVRDRKSETNALMWHWIDEIMDQSEDESSASAIHHQIKLELGIPILKKYEDFQMLWKHLEHMPYDILIKFMDKKNKCYVPVTSIMTVTDMKKLLTAIKYKYESIGFILTDSTDLYYQAMGYKRKKVD
jgi:hypothetical protein